MRPLVKSFELDKSVGTKTIKSGLLYGINGQAAIRNAPLKTASTPTERKLGIFRRVIITITAVKANASMAALVPDHTVIAKEMPKKNLNHNMCFPQSE